MVHAADGEVALRGARRMFAPRLSLKGAQVVRRAANSV
ncbi:MAG: hypothetical protein GC189_10580 [Alphaproteobacteria bacterium]|nr:hypothetical protein [Alphaproteobacteria bacterium]